MAWRTTDLRLGRLVRLAAGALTAASAFAFAGAPAEAHHYRHYRHYAHYGHIAHYAAPHARRWASAIPASPAFSAIVVDANSGRTIWSVAEDAPRHPASITKVMTLYLLFEQLDKGAMTLQTRIPISEHAAAQEPSKLGVEPGETISVDDAIKAVVTRSANDVAVAIAEAIGRDEGTFAEMMTSKAHALGMSSTVYRNASGLPNDEQITTARDLTILARSLEERFPRYFKYFSTHEFEYAGEVIGNHNHLLGRVDGVDGIKTGYTRASGFNLLTSVHRDGRSLLAVVMGGRTAGARDRIMENLIEDHIAEASTAHTAEMVADASRDEQPQRAAVQEPISPQPAAVAASVPSRAPSARQVPPQLAEGDDADGDEAPTLHVAAVKPPAKALPAKQPAPTPHAPSAAELGWVKGPDAASKGQKIAQASLAAPIPPAKPNGVVGKAPADTTIAARSPKEADDGDPAVTRKGWMIQIGATDDAAKASALLARARERDPKALAAAKPITEKVQKGDASFYRARFAGLDPTSAESACRSLKRNGFSCFTAHD
ncbi:serine hydrolase [Roseiarcus sp.]|jgi:D-alanyl-D-alanine carboxypeptidase|uniref:serine hydrolase n=1 Tax=Roseiarcus sp. TaxID=1969460 RepID=UPI003C604136